MGGDGRVGSEGVRLFSASPDNREVVGVRCPSHNISQPAVMPPPHEFHETGMILLRSRGIAPGRLFL